MTRVPKSDLPSRLLLSLSLPFPLHRLLGQLPCMAGTCCGVRWDLARNRAKGAVEMVSVRHSQNRKVCFASPGTGWPQQLCQPHLTTDPRGAHAYEKPAGNSLPDQEAKPALLPVRSWWASLPGSAAQQICFWAGPCGCRHSAQGDGHLQGDGSIPEELCTQGAQLIGSQGHHVRAWETCAAVGMNRDAQLQHGREDRWGERPLLGWLCPPAPTRPAPGTWPGAISLASLSH